MALSTPPPTFPSRAASPARRATAPPTDDTAHPDLIPAAAPTARNTYPPGFACLPSPLRRGHAFHVFHVFHAFHSMPSMSCFPCPYHVTALVFHNRGLYRRSFKEKLLQEGPCNQTSSSSPLSSSIDLLPQPQASVFPPLPTRGSTSPPSPLAGLIPAGIDFTNFLPVAGQRRELGAAIYHSFQQHSRPSTAFHRLSPAHTTLSSILLRTLAPPRRGTPPSTSWSRVVRGTRTTRTICTICTIRIIHIILTTFTILSPATVAVCSYSLSQQPVLLLRVRPMLLPCCASLRLLLWASARSLLRAFPAPTTAQVAPIRTTFNQVSGTHGHL